MLKGRLGPKSTVFSASRLNSAIRKVMPFKSSERRSHASEEPAPLLSGEKWGRGPKNTDGSANKHVRFGGHTLEVLRVRPIIKWEM
jgi:hypothetical protein